MWFSVFVWRVPYAWFGILDFVLLEKLKVFLPVSYCQFSKCYLFFLRHSLNLVMDLHDLCWVLKPIVYLRVKNVWRWRASIHCLVLYVSFDHNIRNDFRFYFGDWFLLLLFWWINLSKIPWNKRSSLNGFLWRRNLLSDFKEFGDWSLDHLFYFFFLSFFHLLFDQMNT